jgi:hypothetical protein
LATITITSLLLSAASHRLLITLPHYACRYAIRHALAIIDYHYYATPYGYYAITLRPLAPHAIAFR